MLCILKNYNFRLQTSYWLKTYNFWSRNSFLTTVHVFLLIIANNDESLYIICVLTFDGVMIKHSTKFDVCSIKSAILYINFVNLNPSDLFGALYLKSEKISIEECSKDKGGISLIQIATQSHEIVIYPPYSLIWHILFETFN